MGEMRLSLVRISFLPGSLGRPSSMQDPELQPSQSPAVHTQGWFSASRMMVKVLLCSMASSRFITTAVECGFIGHAGLLEHDALRAFRQGKLPRSQPASGA